MKQISAGFIINTDGGILMCHPTGRKRAAHNYDIPKGGIEHTEELDETPIQAATRELYEETGIDLSTARHGDVIDCGEMYYTADKNIHLFITEIKKLRIDRLKCTSTFNMYGKQMPECDSYIVSDDPEMLFPPLAMMLEKIKDKHGLNLKF